MNKADLYISVDSVLSSVDECVAAVSIFTFNRKGVDINPGSLKNLQRIEGTCFWMMQLVNSSLRSIL